MVKTYTLKKISKLKAIRWWGDNFEEVKEFLGDRYIEVNELFPRDKLTPEKLNFLINETYKGCCDDKGRFKIIFSKIPWNTIEIMEYLTVLYYGDWLYQPIGSGIFYTSTPEEFEIRFKLVEE